MNSLRDINGDTVLHFGPFAFHLNQRLVVEGDRPLRLGGRLSQIMP